MKKLSLILGLSAVLVVGLIALGSMPQAPAVSDDSPAFGVALNNAIRTLDGVTRSTLNPTRVNAAFAQGGATYAGEPTCAGYPTCDSSDPNCAPTSDPNDPVCAPTSDPNDPACVPTSDPGDPACAPTSDPNDPSCTMTMDPGDPACAPTVDPGGPTCDGRITCSASPTYNPVTCNVDDPDCNYPDPLTQDPIRCDLTAPTWGDQSTCHIGDPICVQPTYQMYRTCDARHTCDGTSNTCDGTFTHWNSTCDAVSQTCDGSPTCAGASGTPWTCGHFTVDGTPTCNGVPTCHSTCDQWYTCDIGAPQCNGTPSKKTSWGSVKEKYRK